MKNILFLLMTILVFMSCSKDENNNDNNELEFIQIKVSSDDIAAPNGRVYLFKVSGYEINSDKPNSWTIDYTPFVSYKKNGENEYLYPVSKYGKSASGDLLINKNEGYSVHSIYWNQLSSLYGTPKAGDEYLLFVELRNGTYARASKRFTITKNSLITVHTPTCTKKSEFVDAKWTISDYTSN